MNSSSPAGCRRSGGQRHSALFLATALLWASTCAAAAPDLLPEPQAKSRARQGVPAAATQPAGATPSTVKAAKAAKVASYSDNPEVQTFIQEMHEKYGFDVPHLSHVFAAVHPNAAVLRAIQPAAVPEQQRSWERYRARFINDRRIDGGLAFWRQNGAELARAAAVYGVPPEIIVAIIGVETEYGRNMGRFSVLEALASLAFDYPPRAAFFRNELEQFLLMARENGTDPLTIKGSYAGAIGIPQFMPSSVRNFAVDFDGDDRIDLSNSVADAVGSVARFLSMHGWQAHAPVAATARLSADPAALIAAGIKPTLALRELALQGASTSDEQLAAAYSELPAALIDLVTPGQTTEYWIGFDNFFVITRYNRSSFYAMSVFQLAEALRTARGSAPSTP